MTLTFLEKTTLTIAGAAALTIGSAILGTPHLFYASYGIALGAEASLLSELRAFGTGLAVLGGLMLAGLWHRGMGQISLAAALVVFVGFPAGRLVGILLDGWPSGGILGALILELALAALCLVAFRKRLSRFELPRADGTFPF